ncbi:MAG: efflux RND transporter periplasmic adaptor subunit [Deltaproteobacteria bacterium]|nr:efflux RND transporter periplasmic adaptor subunit [Deltaproteobacteria bacterium]
MVSWDPEFSGISESLILQAWTILMQNSYSPISRGIEQILGLNRHLSGRKALRYALVMALGVAMAVLLANTLSTGTAPAARYETRVAKRGDISVKVSATGQLQPVNQVDVGTEISGIVKTVEVDYNDRVKSGQVLARLNTDLLEARLRQSKAALTLAQARIQEVQATLFEAQGKWDRSTELAQKNLLTPAEREAAQAVLERAKAALAMANAQVAQAQAQLDSDRTTLEKAIIRSPIDGMVLARQVEPGQTVMAALQSPVLFKLAENLKQMELHAVVDEADIGQVRKGQHATFTVDAYPNQTFEAVITQVRNAPQTVEGVVTYETLLAVDNPDLSLKPGMTATLDILSKELKGVILVPGAALRFTPPLKEEPEARKGSFLSNLFPRRPSFRGQTAKKAVDKGSATVWTIHEGEPVAIPVTIGASDGEMVELTRGEVKPGMPLLVDIKSAAP